MPIPFKAEIDDLFRNHPFVWRKIIAGAFVGFMTVFSVHLRDARNGVLEAPPGFVLGSVIVGAVVGAFGVLLLSLKDVVSKRTQTGQRVSPVLQLYFNMGIISLVLWILTVLVIAPFATILLFGNMGL